jgi:hypothetical protein
MRKVTKRGLIALMAMFCIVSTGLTNQVIAQDKNVITFAPFGIINKLRFRYEHAVGGKSSLGAAVTGYHGIYGIFKGFKIEPAYRFYFSDQALDGLYLQGKMIIGRYNAELDFVPTGNAFLVLPTVTEETSFTSIGGGLNLGYQKAVGKNQKWVIDVNGGFKYCSFPAEYTDRFGNIYFPLEKAPFYLLGPGSWWDGTVAIGYRF